MTISEPDSCKDAKVNRSQREFEETNKIILIGWRLLQDPSLILFPWLKEGANLWKVENELEFIWVAMNLKPKRNQKVTLAWVIKGTWIFLAATPTWVVLLKVKGADSWELSLLSSTLIASIWHLEDANKKTIVNGLTSVPNVQVVKTRKSECWFP